MLTRNMYLSAEMKNFHKGGHHVSTLRNQASIFTLTHKCPDELNASDQTNGDLNVTMYQCHQSSPQ